MQSGTAVLFARMKTPSDSGSARESPDSFAKTWATTVANLGKTVSTPLLKHATLTVALSGAVLYLIGVVRTVGVLKAEGIPLTRGLPIVPLQDYLLRGLSVVANPQIFFGFCFVLLGATLLIAVDEQKAQGGSQARPNRREANWPTLALGLALLFFPVLVVPIAEWVPLVPGAAAAAFCTVQLGLFGSSDGPGRNLQPVGYVAGLLVSLALAFGMRAYFNPPPLETARITSVSGKTWKAKLLLDTGDTLYLVGQKDLRTGHRNVQDLPASSFRSVEISDGLPRDFKTVPELFGIRLWRYWEDDDGGLHIERSP